MPVARPLPPALSELEAALGKESLASVASLGDGVLYALDENARVLSVPEGQPGSFLPASFPKLAREAGPWSNLVAPASRERYRAAFAGQAQAREPVQAVYELAADRRGRSQWVRDTRLPLRDEGGRLRGYVGRLQCEAFRIRATEALADRAWREVAAAVTRRLLHDFNNAMAGIYSLSELYAEPGSSAEAMAEAMGHIRDNAARAQRVSQLIREIGSIAPGDTALIDVAKTLAELEPFLRALLPKSAEVVIDTGEEPLLCRADPNGLKQALLRLAANAAEAAGEEAEIRFVCEARQEGELLRVSAIDNGPGMDADTLARAVEPLFTTKDPAAHAGMGLPAVEAFARRGGGSLELRSSPDEETRATLRLPLVDRRQTLRDAPESEPAKDAPPAVLLYAWEDVSRHPLVEAMLEAGWRYRILPRPETLLEELDDLAGALDGAVLFASPLDESAASAAEALSRQAPSLKLALVPLGASADALPEALRAKCGLVLAGARPRSLLKRLAAYLA